MVALVNNIVEVEELDKDVRLSESCSIRCSYTVSVDMTEFAPKPVSIQVHRVDDCYGEWIIESSEPLIPVVKAQLELEILNDDNDSARCARVKRLALEVLRELET
jgi:hypothetical protein